MDVAQLMQEHNWKPIPHCPGRFVLVASPSVVPPQDLIGPGIELREFNVGTARDPVVVGELPDGGVISYRRPNGTFVHTLNTREGFARKLRQLGLA